MAQSAHDSNTGAAEAAEAAEAAGVGTDCCEWPDAIHVAYVHRKHAHLGYVRDAFHANGIGGIARVSFFARPSAPMWKRAVIYVQEWYDTEAAWSIWERLNAQDAIQFYHSSAPHYWALEWARTAPAAATPERLADRVARLERGLAQADATICAMRERERRSATREGATSHGPSCAGEPRDNRQYDSRDNLQYDSPDMVTIMCSAR